MVPFSPGSRSLGVCLVIPPGSKISDIDVLVVAVCDPCCISRVQLGKPELKESCLSQATETVAFGDSIRTGPWLPGNPVTISDDKVALCAQHMEKPKALLSKLIWVPQELHSQKPRQTRGSCSSLIDSVAIGQW